MEYQEELETMQINSGQMLNQISAFNNIRSSLKLITHIIKEKLCLIFVITIYIPMRLFLFVYYKDIPSNNSQNQIGDRDSKKEILSLAEIYYLQKHTYSIFIMSIQEPFTFLEYLYTQVN